MHTMTASPLQIYGDFMAVHEANAHIAIGFRWQQPIYVLNRHVKSHIWDPPKNDSDASMAFVIHQNKFISWILTQLIIFAEMTFYMSI